MGTHGLFCIRRRNTIICVERTLDGYVYVDLINEFTRKLNEQGSREAKKWLMKVIGEESRRTTTETQIIDFQKSKMIEIDEYREHEQEYVVMFDFNGNMVYINTGVIEAIGSMKQIWMLRRQLKKCRWDIEIGEDIEDLMSEEEREMYEYEYVPGSEEVEKYEVKVLEGKNFRMREVKKLR